MKFNSRVLVAAVALAVSSIPAQAEFNAGATGNGTLFLTMLDASNSISAVFDLGFNYADISAAPNVLGNATNAPASGFFANNNFSWNLAAGDWAPAFSLFSATANPSNVRWTVSATDNTGAPAPGSRGFVTTTTLLGGATNSGMVTAVGNFDNYINANGSSAAVFQNLTNAPSGNGGAVSTSSTGYAGVAFGSNKFVNYGPNVTAAYGASMGLSQVSYGGSTAFAQTNIFSFDPTAQFTLSSAGQLDYVAPIPEADTYAMMVAGLGLIGFIGRRRLSALS